MDLLVKVANVRSAIELPNNAPDAIVACNYINRISLTQSPATKSCYSKNLKFTPLCSLCKTDYCYIYRLCKNTSKQFVMIRARQLWVSLSHNHLNIFFSFIGRCYQWPANISLLLFQKAVVLTNILFLIIIIIISIYLYVVHI